MSIPILTVAIRHEYDIVAARQRARQIAAQLGFEPRDQARISTAVSEIARNAFNYAGGGKVEFTLEGNSPPQVLLIQISDEGPGIPHLAQVLAGQYKSSTGMGLGITGARRLMDRFEIESAPGAGTRVQLRKLMPSRAPFITPQEIHKLVDALAREPSTNPFAEIQKQNLELLDSLNELRRRHDELGRLNQELQDTNRGVIALYAELDEKADHLKRADELKSRFLSNMSHEFRTPLNSIIALSRLLLDRSDGELTTEQDKQVQFIRRAAEDLSELVNDLLDLAKVEAGKIVIRPAEFQVANLFGALRGMLRPLLVNPAVSLIIEEPSDLPLYTDEAKVSQILRNFISNALKFTEHGHVRVTAALSADANLITFSVEDTGIGIAPEDQARIFQEFGQIDHPIQKRVRGTGLGLPLSQKLAELLGGNIALSSELGVGSRFSLTIPVVYAEPGKDGLFGSEPADLDSSRIPVLVIEDQVSDLFLYERFFKDSDYQLFTATSVSEARKVLGRMRPRAILLDILLQNDTCWGFLPELKANPQTCDIPVLVVSTLDDSNKGLGLGADAYAVKPIERTWLLERLHALTAAHERPTILLVEDEDSYRYVLKRYLATTHYAIAEAKKGMDGLQLARQLRPQFIILDLGLPDLSGYELLARLKSDELTRAIPIVIVTSKRLDASDYDRLGNLPLAIFSKAQLERQHLLGVLGEPVPTPTPVPITVN